MGNSPEHYFITQEAISGVILNGDFIQSYIRYTITKIIGVILNGDFIQSYIRYTIIVDTID